MENQETNTALSILISRTREHLKTLKYKPETIQVYERIWNKLEKHQEHETSDKFSIEQGDRFLVEKYGFSLVTGVNKTD